MKLEILKEVLNESYIMKKYGICPYLKPIVVLEKVKTKDNNSIAELVDYLLEDREETYQNYLFKHQVFEEDKDPITEEEFNKLIFKREKSSDVRVRQVVKDHPLKDDFLAYERWIQTRDDSGGKEIYKLYVQRLKEN